MAAAEALVFEPHTEKQERAIFSDRPIVVCGTGIQWGKTSVGAIKAKLAMHTFTADDDAFLIVAPTYKIMQQSTLPAFMRLMSDYGTLSRSDMTFKIHGGGICYLRTGTDPDSIVGITNVRFIWGDEAGLFTLYFWENIQARAAFKEAQIVLTTSPYTLNWLYKEIIRPKQRGVGLANVELVQAASWENPFMPRTFIDERRKTMDPRRFNALFGGQWERMAGLVYDCFDEIENQCEAFTLPMGTKFYAGIDWGWTEPFVFKVRAVTPAGMQYGIFEIYRGHQTIMDIEAQLLRACRLFPIGAIHCGRDQPGYSEHLNRAFSREKLAAHCVPANTDVRLGIDRHYELLKTRRLKYWLGTGPHTLDELDTYHYPEPEDAKPDQKIKDQMPVQQHDHAMDAERYLSIALYDAHLRRAPIVPSEQKPETQHQRIERLKRRPRVGGSERWSA